MPSTPQGLVGVTADCYKELLAILGRGEEAGVKDSLGQNEPVVLRNGEIYEVASGRKVIDLEAAMAKDKNSRPVSVYGSLFFAGFKILAQREHLSVFQRGEETVVYNALTNSVMPGRMVRV